MNEFDVLKELIQDARTEMQGLIDKLCLNPVLEERQYWQSLPGLQLDAWRVMDAINRIDGATGEIARIQARRSEK